MKLKNAREIAVWSSVVAVCLESSRGDGWLMRAVRAAEPGGDVAEAERDEMQVAVGRADTAIIRLREVLGSK